MSSPSPITETAAYRAAFASADADLRVRQAKLYIALCLVLVPGWSALDYVTYPQLAGRMLVSRLLCDAVLLPGFLALFTARGRAHVTLVCKVTPVIPCATICWMIYASEGALSPYYAGINLCLVGVTLLIPYTLGEAAAICGIVVGCYAAACGLHPAGWVGTAARAGTGVAVVNNLYFLAGTTLIAMLACHYTHRRRVEEFRLRYELDANNRELAETLRGLKETEVQLVQSEKMNALGKLSAGLLHEVNNPLNYMAMGLQVAKQDAAGNAELTETLNDVEEGMTRIRGVINDLRSFAYPTSAADAHEFAIDDALTSALRLTTQELGGIEVDRAGVAGVRAVGGQTQVCHVLMNLVVNAAHAVKAKFPDAGGRIAVAAAADGGRVRVTVRDNGCGVPPANLPKLMDAFFTTKGPGKGMGLGLSICHTIVKNHGGQIRVASEFGQWTEFAFDLPAATADTTPTGNATVLNTTDEPARRAA